jgi:hypothetical protein
MQRAAIFLTLIFAIFSVQAKAEKGFLIKTSLTEPKGGVALLGRMVEADAKSLHMEYMVVDTNQKNAITSTPAIVALLKEPASVGMENNDGGKATVGILATPTEYTSAK